MTRDDFSDRTSGVRWLRAWTRSFGRARGPHPRCASSGRRPPAKTIAQECLTLQELLASEMTRAVLRADALEMRSFEATLQAAAKRLAAPVPGDSRKSRS